MVDAHATVGDLLDSIPVTARSIAVLDRTKEPGAIGEPLGVTGGRLEVADHLPVRIAELAAQSRHRAGVEAERGGRHGRIIEHESGRDGSQPGAAAFGQPGAAGRNADVPASEFFGAHRGADGGELGDGGAGDQCHCAIEAGERNLANQQAPLSTTS